MGVIDRVTTWAEQQYAATIASLRSWYDSGTHHGCFCGAGTLCAEPIDDLDRCCQQHDTDYGAAGVSADTMWEIPNGFVNARNADAALVACASGAATTNTEYQQNLIWLFGTRVEIADAMSAWLRTAQEIEDGLNRFRDWLGSTVSSAGADSTEVQEGVAQYAANLTAQGAAPEEVAAVAAEHGASVA